MEKLQKHYDEIKVGFKEKYLTYLEFIFKFYSRNNRSDLNWFLNYLDERPSSHHKKVYITETFRDINDQIKKELRIFLTFHVVTPKEEFESSYQEYLPLAIKFLTEVHEWKNGENYLTSGKGSDEFYSYLENYEKMKARRETLTHIRSKLDEKSSL